MGWFGKSRGELRVERDEIAKKLVRLQNDVTVALRLLGWKPSDRDDFGTGQELIEFASQHVRRETTLEREAESASQIARREEERVQALLLAEHEKKLGKGRCDCIPGVVCPKCSEEKLGVRL